MCGGTSSVTSLRRRTLSEIPRAHLGSAFHAKHLGGLFTPSTLQRAWRSLLSPRYNPSPMATLHAFRALRPNATHAARIAAVPYDVVNTDEARALAEGNPLRFLRVSRAELDVSPG